jgi:hypothetical protein
MPTDPFLDPDHPLWEPTAEEIAEPRPPDWNVSRHDPWWRAWLTSWQLFATYRDVAPRVGVEVSAVFDGALYECNSDGEAISVQVWIARTGRELIVAYPSFYEQHGLHEFGGPWEFEEWIGRLRLAPPFELGHGIDARCRYGATWSGDPATPPVVKWATSGDWAALARNWYYARVEGEASRPADTRSG